MLIGQSRLAAHPNDVGIGVEPGRWNPDPHLDRVNLTRLPSELSVQAGEKVYYEPAMLEA